jgi:hypothetical protein
VRHPNLKRKKGYKNNKEIKKDSTTVAFEPNLGMERKTTNFLVALIKLELYNDLTNFHLDSTTRLELF